MSINWNAVRTALLDGAAPGVTLPDAAALESLHATHGWEGIGAAADAVGFENKLRSLVRAGVPFDEAARLMGLRECERTDLLDEEVP